MKKLLLLGLFFLVLCLCIAPTSCTMDTDADGISDNSDNCPTLANPYQTDEDQDLVGDECDNCPHDKNPDQQDSDGDKIGDVCDRGSVAITAGAITTCASFNSKSIVINKPSGVVSGDILIASISNNGYLTCSPPSGWNLIRQNTSGGNCGSAVFYLVAGGSEPTSYTFTFSSNVYSAGLMSRFLNVSNTTPVEVSSVTNTNGYTASSITTSTNNDMLMLVLASGNGAQTWSNPSGWSTGITGNLNSTSTGFFYKIQSTPGSSGAVTASPSIMDTGTAYLLALKPAFP
jgi:hypothetical protein